MSLDVILSWIEGEVRARRMQLEEGAVLNGTVDMGSTRTEEAETPKALVSAES